MSVKCNYRAKPVIIAQLRAAICNQLSSISSGVKSISVYINLYQYAANGAVKLQAIVRYC